jgi:hypothetical protein
MQRLARSVLVGLAISTLLGACGSDSSSSPTPTTAPTGSQSTGGSTDSTGATGTTPTGAADCAALKDAITGMTINWQIVLGLSNSDTSEWATLPLGSLPQFGTQISTLSAALAGDGDATEALSFMKGADDIVQRGIGGDAAAKDDLATYLGDDLTANISKQIPIGIAYSNLGCN